MTAKFMVTYLTSITFFSTLFTSSVIFLFNGLWTYLFFTLSLLLLLHEGRNFWRVIHVLKATSGLLIIVVLTKRYNKCELWFQPSIIITVLKLIYHRLKSLPGQRAKPQELLLLTGRRTVPNHYRICITIKWLDLGWIRFM